MIDIKKCERCPQMEELAEGFRQALIEASKLIEFILLPSTTDADRAEIRRRAFGDLSDASGNQQEPPISPNASQATEKPCGVIEHGPTGDPNCPDCKG